LSHFNVTFQLHGNIVQWKTESEVENMGFNIYRRQSSDETPPQLDQFKKINNKLIPGAGNSSDENYYQFIDRDILSNTTYWYYLEDVAYDGQRNQYDMVSVETANLSPDKFQLYQNYPNPFNPQTRISFSLDLEGPVKLVIYDVNGQIIKTIIDDVRTRGGHTYSWDGTDEEGKRVSSGLYYYRLTSDDQSQSRKMLIIR
jgi:hypothetical protein